MDNTVCIFWHSSFSALAGQGQGLAHTLSVIILSTDLVCTFRVVTLGECTCTFTDQRWWQAALMVHTSSDIIVKAI